MKFIRRAFLVSISTVCALSLAGCSGAGSTPGFIQSLRENTVLQNAAKAALSGKIYDRAAIAIRDGNENALANATEELAFVDPLAAAEQMVKAAAWLDLRAYGETDAALKTQLEIQSAQKYRQALKITPNFPSKNPDLLNALGYFLADRGASATDFQNAEKFTRSSLKRMDAQIQETAQAPLSGPLVALQKFNRAQTARDSLAWALFRQGKFAAARKEQIAAVNEAQTNTPAGQKISAELYFHLAEIERALKNTDAAKVNYQAALKIDPDHAPSLQGLLSLAGSTPSPAPGAPPPEESDALPALSA